MKIEEKEGKWKKRNNKNFAENLLIGIRIVKLSECTSMKSFRKLLNLLENFHFLSALSGIYLQ